MPCLQIHDTHNIELPRVDRFANDDGYFVRPLRTFNHSILGKKGESGNNDLPIGVKEYNAAGSYQTVNTPGGRFTKCTPGHVPSTSFQYYADGYEEPKEADYGKLNNDLAVNSTSMKYL